jgi:hypothetical protein
MKSVKWSPKTHGRFLKQDRDLVVYLLCVAKQYIIPKYVWISYIIPYVIKPIEIYQVIQVPLKMKSTKQAVEKYLGVKLCFVEFKKIGMGRKKYARICPYFLDDLNKIKSL